MKNRLNRLLKVLEWYPRTGVSDIDALALQLGTTPATIRRDLRDLREAGAFDATGAVQTETKGTGEAPEIRTDQVGTPLLPALVLQQTPANDGFAPQSGAAALSDDELAAMYVGARFLAAQGDPASAESALAVIARVEHAASPSLLDRLTQMDTRFRFGPRGTERRVRQLVAQAITERRVLSIRYRGERDHEYKLRLVEPLAQFFIHDRWSFVAYCQSAEDIRQFRHERCRDVRLTDRYFTERNGLSLEGFIQQRRRALAGAEVTR